MAMSFVKVSMPLFRPGPAWQKKHPHQVFYRPFELHWLPVAVTAIQSKGQP
ncbi:hypothetical protein GJA_1574 [Janthinobacterium agaricidamnosum NBRC 102515 = DSM 9628]|uniref:Uncharacterized protein n=1 Tax=Janthinobacterium agaricidamnosum NBRC 102515 = DSM 9628 TaxID=1349767 RepID=W0V4D2_9BURK|nr:hypothetical protein GJA_1574 [Janthinobacterium agaricidamnosum NBRC 102515 = DSM 9628]